MSASVAEVKVRATGTDEAVSQIQMVTEAAREARDAIGELRSPRVQILSEPLTYDARLVRAPGQPLGLRAVSDQGTYSYVKDFVLYHQRMGDWRSSEARLQRHAEEMRRVGESRERIFHPDVEADFESRAVNWTAGTGGYFAPPLWLVERFATAPTPERVLASLAPQFELPQGAQSVNVPRLTTDVRTDPTQLNSPATSTDLKDAAVSSAVATLAGNADVPMQMLEQSPVGAHLDWLVFTAMEARYGYQLELQLMNGVGAATPQGSGNNQLLGILNNTAIPAANVITYTDATPTPKNMIQTSSGAGGGPVAQAIAQVGNNRKVKPEAWLMTTSRAAWITSGELTLPLALSNQLGPGAFDLLAYPVHQDDALPTINGNQDTMIICRPSDWLVLESDRRTQVYTDVLSGTLMARIQMRRYVAAMLLYPSSVAYMTGTGMAVQTGF